MRRSSIGLTLVLALASACTGGGGPAETPHATSPSSDATCPAFVLDRNGGECVDTFDLSGEAYRVTCQEVPEMLLDVAVDARWGHGPVRAIAAVPSVQAVAVSADDDECGAFALAVRDDLPQDTKASIAHEVEAAASLPPDLD